MLTQEGGKGASLSEVSSILLTGLDWNTDIANLIKGGPLLLPPLRPARPWLIFLSNGVTWGLAGLGNITTCGC